MQTSSNELLDAIKKGQAAEVKRILGSHPELLSAQTPDGVSAILLAIYCRHPEIAEIFLAHGLKPLDWRTTARRTHSLYLG